MDKKKLLEDIKQGLYHDVIQDIDVLMIINKVEKDKKKDKILTK